MILWLKPWHNEKLIDTIKELLDKKEGSKPAKASVKVSRRYLHIGRFGCDAGYFL